MPAGTIRIAADNGGEFSAFLALPDSGRGPGVVVLQEIFGINFVMREICHSLAAQGYVAICPDLFWHQEPDVELCDKTEGEWQRAFGFYQGFDVDRGITDAATTLKYLRNHEACTGKVGAVGYCLGGKLAYLMATRTDADCSVGFYGVGIDDSLDEAGNISHPHMQHIAEEDQFVPKDAQAAVKNTLAGNNLVTVQSYPGVDHAFARIGGAHYDAKAADTANTRTLDFFKTNLG